MTQHLTDEQRTVIDKVEKLLRLASRNTNEQEAALAASKAQELLTAYNLDMAAVEQSSGASSGAREDAKLKGGVYQYQRHLWCSVADLNFCLYWCRQRWETVKRRKRSWDGTMREREVEKRFWEHRVVGRKVNVTATRAMASYLEQAIERLVRERLNGQNNMLFSRWAVSYREGAAANIMERIWDRRRHLMDEEKRKQQAAEAAARAAGRDGVSTATALTIATYSTQEDDANYDFIYGEGTSARWAADRAERARKAKEAEDAYTAWAQANPKEAAKEEAKRKRDEERAARRRSGSSGGKEQDLSAFYAGYDAGKKVSLEPQVNDPKSSRRIAHG